MTTAPDYEKNNTAKRNRLAVLIPCFNENATVAQVIADYREVYPDAKIYVYDNNSTDGTAQTAIAAGAVVRHVTQQGKGNVCRRMFAEIEADCYLLTDGDMTYPAADTMPMVRAIAEKKADMATGDRLSSTYFTENKRLFHNFGNRLVRTLINNLFNSDIKDVMTGSRAFSRRFVKNFPVMSSGFELETEMTVHALDKKFDILEFPITYRDRPEGSASKLNTLSDGMKVVRTIFSLLRDYNPLKFFGLMALLAALIACILVTPVFVEYWNTGLVPRFPTLIVSCFTLMLALLLFSTGLVLDAIQRKHALLYRLRITDYDTANK